MVTDKFGPSDEDFDEAFYLRRYPDVAQAVMSGIFSSGREHFERHGRSEGRQAATSALPAAQNREANTGPLKLFVCVYDDARLLPHFLKHYSAIGVTEFHIAVSNHLAHEVRRYSDCYDLRIYTDLDVADSFLGGNVAVSTMRSEIHQDGEWAIIADLDEFLEIDAPLHQILNEADDAGANVVRGIMHDRCTVDGQLSTFSDTSDLELTYPIAIRFIQHIMHGCDVKGILVKGPLSSSLGHHYFDDEIAHSRVLTISHYKWNDRAFDRARVACLRLRDAGMDWDIEYERALEHIQINGRIAWEDVDGRLSLSSRARDRLCAQPTSDTSASDQLSESLRKACSLTGKSLRDFLLGPGVDLLSRFRCVVHDSPASGSTPRS